MDRQKGRWGGGSERGRDGEKGRERNERGSR